MVGTGLLRGTAGPDVIVARGAAEVHAGAGDDRVCGAFLVHAGPGDDRVRYSRDDGDFPELDGGGGRDRLVGGAGPDSLIGGTGRDTGVGGPGADTCSQVERRRSCASGD